MRDTADRRNNGISLFIMFDPECLVQSQGSNPEVLIKLCHIRKELLHILCLFQLSAQRNNAVADPLI